MTDSCRPRKLEPGFEQTYSMPSDLMTSTMKSEPVRSAVSTSAGEGVPTSAAADIAGSGVAPRPGTGCFADTAGAAASAAAPAAALRRKSRRGMPLFFCFAMDETLLVGQLLSHVHSRSQREASLHLEDIAFAGDEFVKNRVDEEAEEQAGEKSRDDDDSERLLGVAANAGGHGGGEKAEAGDERGHHDRAQAKQRSLQRCFADVFAFEAQFVDVADQNDGCFDGDAEQREKAEGAGYAERRVRELQRDQSADRFGEYNAEGDSSRKLEIAVEREEDHEDQENRKRADDEELRFGVQQFAILAAPVEAVTFGEIHFIGDGLLARLDDAFEIPSLNRKLDANVARIVFAIDERRARGFLQRGEFGKWNLLPGGGGDEQIADSAGVGTEFRVCAHDKVEQFFALNHLSGGLSTDRGLHDRLHVGNVDAIPRDFGAVRFDEQAWLAEFAHNGELCKARGFVEHIFDFDGFLLENVEIGAEDFHGQRAFEAREGFVHGIFSGLGEIEDHAGVGVELFLKIGDELFFCVD